MISWHIAATEKNFMPGRGFQSASIDDPVRISKCMSRYIWCPVIYKNGHRRESNFISAEWAVLDFDGDTREISVIDAINNVFPDLQCIIGTTKSHRKEKNGFIADRFRVAIKLEKPVFDLRTYKYILKDLTDFYDSDPACKDGARFFYPCTKISCINWLDAEPLEIPEVPDWFLRPKPKEYYESYKARGSVPPKVRKYISHPVEPGARNKTFYGVAKDLLQCGYSEDETTELILSSPTYESIRQNHDNEIRATVRSAAAALKS